MALPKLDTPVYSLVQPSTGEKIKFRPFLVKEEKILLTALESNDEETINESVKQIINNCIVTEGIDLDHLPMFDIEYIFLQLRAKSVSDVVTLRYRNNACKEGTDGAPCGRDLPVMVKLDQIEVVTSEEHKAKIELGEGIGVIMQYPNLELMTEFQNKKMSQDSMFTLISKCIKTIYDADNIYDPSSYKEEELEEFILSMSQPQFEKIKNFFDTMPQLKKDIEVTCKQCGYKKSVTLTGLKDFFG